MFHHENFYIFDFQYWFVFDDVQSYCIFSNAIFFFDWSIFYEKSILETNYLLKLKMNVFLKYKIRINN